MDKTKLDDLSKKNHLVVNYEKNKWGRGIDIVEAIKNAKAGINTKMVLFIFRNDNWDIYDNGTVHYKKEDLIYKSDLNFEPYTSV